MTGQTVIHMLQIPIALHLPAAALPVTVHPAQEAMLEIQIQANSMWQAAAVSAKCLKKIRYFFQAEMKP